MNESIISVRYTKALFSLAVEKGVLDVVKNDIESVYVLMSVSEELQQVFKNPVLKPSKKEEIIELVFTSFNPITISFIKLLLQNRREEHLQDIARNFLTRYRRFKGIETALFTTAISVDQNIYKKIKSIIEQQLKTEVELNSQIDEKIIGGFILKVGDKQIDASVLSNLNKLRRKLLDTSVC